MDIIIKELKQNLKEWAYRRGERAKNTDNKLVAHGHRSRASGLNLALQEIERLEQKYRIQESNEPLTAEWLRQNGKRWGFFERQTSNLGAKFFMQKVSIIEIEYLPNDYYSGTKILKTDPDGFTSYHRIDNCTVSMFLKILDVLGVEEVGE